MLIKKIVCISTILLTTLVEAQTVKYCGEIKRFRIWADGSDTYGTWVEYKKNPEQCSGGFYIKQDANSKDTVFSFLLAQQSMDKPVCIQVIHGSEIGNRCKLNYAMNL